MDNESYEQYQPATATPEEMSLVEKTGRMTRLMHRYVKHTAEAHGGLGDPLRGQGRVLAMLAAKPQITQKELCFLLGMRQQSLSELLRKLEEKGYITRKKSEEDGRVINVTLTPEGTAAVPDLDEMDPDEEVFSSLTEDECISFENMVDTVSDDLRSKLLALGDDPDAPIKKARPHERNGHEDRRGSGYHGRDDHFHGRGGYHSSNRGSYRGPHHGSDRGPHRGPNRGGYRSEGEYGPDNGHHSDDRYPITNNDR